MNDKIFDYSNIPGECIDFIVKHFNAKFVKAKNVFKNGIGKFPELSNEELLCYADYHGLDHIMNYVVYIPFIPIYEEWAQTDLSVWEKDRSIWNIFGSDSQRCTVGSFDRITESLYNKWLPPQRSMIDEAVKMFNRYNGVCEMVRLSKMLEEQSRLHATLKT